MSFATIAAVSFDHSLYEGSGRQFWEVQVKNGLDSKRTAWTRWAPVGLREVRTWERPSIRPW